MLLYEHVCHISCREIILQIRNTFIFQKETCMNRSIKRLVFICFLALGTALFSKAAFAFDEQMVLKHLQDRAQANEILFTFQSTEKSDDGSLILKNVDYFDEKREVRQQMDTLVLGNLKQDSQGRISYDFAEANKLVQKGKTADGEATVRMERVYADGLKFNPDEGDESFLWPSTLNKIEVTEIEINADGQNGKSLVSFPSAEVTGVERTGPGNFTAQEIGISTGTAKVARDQNDVAVQLGAVNIRDLEYFGLVGLDIGLIDFGALEMNTESRNGEAVALLFEGMTIENFYSADATVENRPLVSNKDLMAEIKPLSVMIDGKALGGWVRGFGQTKNDAATGLVTSEGGLEDIYIDFNALPKNPQNEQLLKTLSEVDLIQMVINLNGKGSWNRKTGELEVNNYTLELEGNAAFNLSAKFTGYTEELARQFATALNQMNAETDPTRKNALAFQALAYLANLSVERLEISLNDETLVDRIVNVQANKLNQEPEQVRAMLGPIAFVTLNSYQLPELAGEVSQAIDGFLQGGRKIVISAEPVNGLAATEMVALFSAARSGATTPQEVLTRVNLKVITQ